MLIEFYCYPILLMLLFWVVCAGTLLEKIDEVSDEEEKDGESSSAISHWYLNCSPPLFFVTNSVEHSICLYTLYRDI